MYKWGEKKKRKERYREKLLYPVLSCLSLWSVSITRFLGGTGGCEMYHRFFFFCFFPYTQFVWMCVCFLAGWLFHPATLYSRPRTTYTHTHTYIHNQYQSIIPSWCVCVCVTDVMCAANDILYIHTYFGDEREREKIKACRQLIHIKLNFSSLWFDFFNKG